MLLNIHRNHNSHKAYKGRGEGKGYGGGGRGRLYTYRYTVTTRMTPALRWAAMRAILMFHNCEGQRHKTVSTDHSHWSERRAETDLNWGPSAYQPTYRLIARSNWLTVLILNQNKLITDSCREGWFWKGMNPAILINTHRQRHSPPQSAWAWNIFHAAIKLFKAPQSLGLKDILCCH